MKTIHPMKLLYARLKVLGFNKAFIKDILPEWWEDDAALSPSAFMELKMLLARHLGLEFTSLLDDQKSIVFKSLSPCEFKIAKGIKKSELTIASSMATSAAKMALASMPATTNYHNIPKNAQSIRQQFLSSGESSVNLQNLLSYIWGNGIPVIYLSKIPPKARKMDGMVVKIGDRPVIILARANKSYAWQLFTLAHELGHVAHNHISTDSTLVDETVDKSSNDLKEIEANRFASELLTGDPEGITPTKSLRALSYIEPEANAPELFFTLMLNKLSIEELPKDSFNFLTKITGDVKRERIF